MTRSLPADAPSWQRTLLNEVIDDSKIAQAARGVFFGADNEDLSKRIEAMANNKVDEELLCKALAVLVARPKYKLAQNLEEKMDNKSAVKLFLYHLEKAKNPAAAEAWCKHIFEQGDAVGQNDKAVAMLDKVIKKFDEDADEHRVDMSGRGNNILSTYIAEQNTRDLVAWLTMLEEQDIKITHNELLRERIEGMKKDRDRLKKESKEYEWDLMNDLIGNLSKDQVKNESDAEIPGWFHGRRKKFLHSTADKTIAGAKKVAPYLGAAGSMMPRRKLSDEKIEQKTKDSAKWHKLSENLQNEVNRNLDRAQCSFYNSLAQDLNSGKFAELLTEQDANLFYATSLINASSLYTLGELKKTADEKLKEEIRKMEEEINAHKDKIFMQIKNDIAEDDEEKLPMWHMLFAFTVIVPIMGVSLPFVGGASLPLLFLQSNLMGSSTGAGAIIEAARFLPISPFRPIEGIANACGGSFYESVLTPFLNETPLVSTATQILDGATALLNGTEIGMNVRGVIEPIAGHKAAQAGLAIAAGVHVFNKDVDNRYGRKSDLNKSIKESTDKIFEKYKDNYEARDFDNVLEFAKVQAREMFNIEGAGILVHELKQRPSIDDLEIKPEDLKKINDFKGLSDEQFNQLSEALNKKLQDLHELSRSGASLDDIIAGLANDESLKKALMLKLKIEPNILHNRAGVMLHLKADPNMASFGVEDLYDKIDDVINSKYEELSKIHPENEVEGKVNEALSEEARKIEEEMEIMFKRAAEVTLEKHRGVVTKKLDQEKLDLRKSKCKPSEVRKNQEREDTEMHLG